MVDIANLAIQISVALLTLMAVLFAFAAFFGIREARQARRRNKELRNEIQKTARMRTELEKRLAHLETELQSLVFVAHLFHEGQVSYTRGEYDRAISYFEEALTLQPSNNEIKVRLARTFVNKGQNGRADRLLRAVTEKDPNNTDAWRALATSRRYVNHKEAIDYAQKALQLDESSVDNWNYLGLLLRDEGRYEEALAAHQESVARAPTDPISYFFMALLLMKLQRSKEASHYMYEAFAKTEIKRRSDSIKPIWADTIEWGYRRSLDTPGEEEEARRIAERLRERCIEDRNLQAVLGHMIFFLFANDIDPKLDSTISLFPNEEIEIVLARPPYKTDS